MITIFTDGSSSRKSGWCAWAFVSMVELPTGTAYFQKCGYEKGTNQRAELQAIVQAMKHIPEGQSALIISDSEYSIKAMTTYRRKWRLNGFLNSEGNQIANFALITEGHSLLDKRKIEFQHVRGHTGVVGNELADKLATTTRYVAEGRASLGEIDQYLIMRGEDVTKNQV